MHEYVFKMKKGDIEIELKSDDIAFVEEQLNKWREDIMQKQRERAEGEGLLFGEDEVHENKNRRPIDGERARPHLDAFNANCQ